MLITSCMRLTPRRLLLVLVGCLATLARSFAHEVPAEMFAAAKTFLGTLSAEQKKLAVYPLTDAERENWNFVPLARNGLTFKKMSNEQYALGIALLRSGVSHTGLARVQAIMQLELVLKELEKDTPAGRRDPSNYFITVFGEPSADKSWGWRFEGHHTAFNFTVVGGKHVFFTPSFLGSNPAEVRAGPRKGERVLAEEEDLGHTFIQSLDAAQQQDRHLRDAGAQGDHHDQQEARRPARPGRHRRRPTEARATRDASSPSCKIFTGRWRPELAAETFAQLTAPGLDKLTFAWAGPIDARRRCDLLPHPSPDYLIEFDNTQNNWNHIHTTVRAFKGDFGHDLLAEHYAKEHTVVREVSRTVGRGGSSFSDG
jgi:hypothetical protein